MPFPATQNARVRDNGPATNLVPVDEAATLLDRSPRTVRRLAASGALPAQRIGARTWAIDRASLDNYRKGAAWHGRLDFNHRPSGHRRQRARQPQRPQLPVVRRRSRLHDVRPVDYSLPGMPGFTVAAAAPASYTATVAVQQDEARRTSLRSGKVRDATDPDAPTYFAKGQ